MIDALILNMRVLVKQKCPAIMMKKWFAGLSVSQKTAREKSPEFIKKAMPMTKNTYLARKAPGVSPVACLTWRLKWEAES
jgi:hypothetical protein